MSKLIAARTVLELVNPGDVSLGSIELEKVVYYKYSTMIRFFNKILFKQFESSNSSKLLV